ncbi:hypothetical protein BpHYR1_030106 [Brachionus plicatilis]|uniref:Uncharacterized protein n=1 Tax=Brachionus plicatilis TaxID=10195 RepID=A0A3M7PU80_BRAPC|nr:hypothetical protein BpHYR1_030106 [Brachionus plicatilis]
MKIKNDELNLVNMSQIEVWVKCLIYSFFMIKINLYEISPSINFSLKEFNTTVYQINKTLILLSLAHFFITLTMESAWGLLV